jgi:hypothetical protein
MKKEHWMYLSRSDFENEFSEGADARLFDWTCPFAVPFTAPFDFVLVYAIEEIPRSSEKV